MISKRFISTFIVISFLSGIFTACRQKPTDPAVVRNMKYKESLKELYPKLNMFYATNFIPGMSVAVSINNEIVWADGFGYSNAELKVKSSPSNKYRIGQVGELITALTAAKLYELNQLPIDKPVTEICSILPKSQPEYTIRQLAAHTAGIPLEKNRAGYGDKKTLESIIQSFINDTLGFEPGTAFGHTELGFDLIGYLIERTQNKPFPKVVKQILTDTLKLTATMPDIPLLINENKSSHYDFSYMAQAVVADQIDLRGKEASAGYLSTVTDLVKMGNLLLYPGYLKQETIDILTNPYKLTDGSDCRYGFGLIVIKDREGRVFYGEHGGITGGSAALLIYPEDKIVVAMAANINSGTLELPVFDVAEVFINQIHPKDKR